jgi:hypothetical protein
MESRVLPAKAISALLSENFICVKVNIDTPPAPAQKLLEQVNGNTLPFYAYITPEGRFISGTSGFRDEARFKADLEGVIKSDLLKVSADAEKGLAAAAEQAGKDLESKKFGSVVKAARDAESVKGVSDSKKKLRQLLGQAVVAGRALLQDADELVKANKHVEALAIIRRVQSDFRGTELIVAANAAAEAIERAHPSPGPDTVVLKDGTTVNGRIMARTEELIMLQTPDGKRVKIEKEKIAEIKTEPKK